MEQLQSLDKWHQTRKGHLTFGVAELLIAYGFASLAIDTAHTWAYALAIIFGFGSIRNLLRIVHQPQHDKPKR